MDREVPLGFTPSMLPDVTPDLDPRKRTTIVREHERRLPPRRQDQQVARSHTRTGKDAPPTSSAAARRVFPRTGSRRKQLLDWMATLPDGATDDEVERHFQWSHQAASPCRNGLMLDGWLRDSGKKRPVLHSGNLAVVWTLTRDARAALADQRPTGPVE